MEPSEKPTAEALMSKIHVAPNGCWIWTGSRFNTGYGRLKVCGKTHTAHRLVYEALVGPIPEGLTLDHMCHNRDTTCAGGHSCPHRACVNPAHLEPAPIRTNILRGRADAGHKARQTHCKNGHPLSGTNLYVTPSGSRQCRICRSDRDRAAKRSPAGRAREARYAEGTDRRAYVASYRESNKERSRAYQRDYYARNRERILARQRAKRSDSA